MKTAVSQLTTYSADIETELAAYASAGFSAVELVMSKTSAYLADNSVASLTKYLQTLGLQASAAVGPAPVAPALLLASGSARDSYFERLKDELDFCSSFGISVLGVGADALRFATSDDWYRQAIANLRFAAAMAADAGVVLSFEYLSLPDPEGPFVVDNLAKARQLITDADVGSVGLTIDFFHHYASGGTAEDLAKTQGIANVHVTDVRALVEGREPRDADRVLPGTGIVPVMEYRDAILSTGYVGFWTLELLDPVLWERDVSEVAALSAEAMRRFVR